MNLRVETIPDLGTFLRQDLLRHLLAFGDLATLAIWYSAKKWSLTLTAAGSVDDVVLTSFRLLRGNHKGSNGLERITMSKLRRSHGNGLQRLQRLCNWQWNDEKELASFHSPFGLLLALSCSSSIRLCPSLVLHFFRFLSWFLTLPSLISILPLLALLFFLFCFTSSSPSLLLYLLLSLTSLCAQLLIVNLWHSSSSCRSTKRLLSALFRFQRPPPPPLRLLLCLDLQAGP